MIKPIVLYGNAILREKSLPIKAESDVSELVQDLWDTMENALGAGLAAPQIGVSQQIFVANLAMLGWRKVFINPTLIQRIGENVKEEEGCLSIPKLNGQVSRPESVEISYFDENWKFHHETFKGARARVIQHEYDHLVGMLWIDRTNMVNGALIEALHSIMKRLVTADYPTI